MTTAWILGLLASGGAMAAHTLSMRKVWWAPIFGVGVQAIWIVYVLSNKVTWPLLPETLWYLAWYLVSIKKWKRERHGPKQSPPKKHNPIQPWAYGPSPGGPINPTEIPDDVTRKW